MDFVLNDVQRMVLDTARRVGSKFGLDYWRKLDAEKSFPAELWQAICESGLCGVALPEEYGGSGLGMLEMALIIEALAESGGGSTVGQMFMCNPIFGGVSIAKYGTEEQKRDWLPKLVSGEWGFCMALTEPDAGSNTLDIKTFAKPDGDGWRVNGQKIWITAIPESTKTLLVARTTKLEDSSSRTNGISLFMIDTDRAGISYTPIDKLGTNTMSSSQVFFDNVRVDPDELIGTLDGGFRELLDVLNAERIVTTAGLVGAGRLAVRLGVDYANQRKVFGKAPVSSYQGVQFPLAQAHAEVECAALMNYRAASNFDSDLPFGSDANRAKLIASQAASSATERAMQVMGGMGYSKEMHVERLWRDARLFRFAPVAEEMILNYIAVHDLGMPRSY